MHIPSRARSTTISKKTDGVDYFADLLDLVDLELVRMHDAATIDRPRYYLRHDGCGNLDFDTAVAMAQAEADRGLTATYFLLPPGSYPNIPSNYYGRWEDGRIVHDDGLVDRCKRLLDLGHDLGLHSDVVSLSLTTGIPAREILEREVEFFTSHGIRLRGTASHGQPLCRELSYNNREVFVGCLRAGWETGRTVHHQGNSVTLHSLDMSDFGFEYEAYSLPRDSRLSESGGRWGGRIGGAQLPREQLAESFDLAEFRSYVRRASPEHGVRALQLLVHPCHWERPVTADEPVPTLDVDPMHGTHGCTARPVCDKFVEQYGRRLVGTYVGSGAVAKSQLTAAVLDLRETSYEQFAAGLRKVHKGNAVRDARKADDAGLVVHEFEWRNHVPDIAEVNHSKEVRSGGPMTAAYRRDVDELGGAPELLHPLRPVSCPVHWSRAWGVFEPRPGHRQGEVVTDEKLVAYVKLKRQGSLVIYSSILGHGDYLALGTMYRLHFAIVERLLQPDNPLAAGLDGLLYGAHDSGTAGLQMWKKRCLFRPARLVVAPENAPAAWRATA